MAASMDFAFLLKKMLTVLVTPVGMVLALLILAFLAIPTRKVLPLPRQRRKDKGAVESSEDGQENDEEGSANEKEDTEAAPEPVPLFTPQKQGGAATFFVAGAIFLLYGLSIEPVSNLLVATVEKRVLSADSIPDGFSATYIVVLPSGVRDETLPLESRLSYVSLARLHGGLEWWKRFPEATLVFSGTSEETEAMKAVALRAEVPEPQILEETEARDTRGHAVYLGAILQQQPFLLVTSALHLPRSLALFQGEGLHPVGVPVDFLARVEGGIEFEPRHLLPKAMFLNRSERALHEMVGMIWAEIRGQTS